MPDHARASQAAGADGHLTKPITADDLFAIVESAGRRLAEGPVPAARRA
jgi:CheY-like chemotaxis protein